MQAITETRTGGNLATNLAPNSSRVPEILGWYGSDNPGTLTNLARLLNHGRLGGTGKLVILPVDRGFEHGPARNFGPNPPAYDPRYHFELAIESGCNAYAAPLGFLEAGARDFAGQIPLILNVNDHDVLRDEKERTFFASACRALAWTRTSGRQILPAEYGEPERLEL